MQRLLGRGVAFLGGSQGAVVKLARAGALPERRVSEEAGSRFAQQSSAFSLSSKKERSSSAGIPCRVGIPQVYRHHRQFVGSGGRGFSTWRSGYHRLSEAQRNDIGFRMFFLGCMLILPSVYVFTAGDPRLLRWVLVKCRWVEYPAQHSQACSSEEVL